MSGVCKYWVDKREGDGYKCPWCARDLKSKLSKSEKNPDRPFVSCDKKFGGCGLFCFLDAQPNEQYNPNKGGGGGGGSIFGGSYAAKPPTESMEIAALKAKVATIESQLATVFADLAALQGVRDDGDHSDHSNEAARKKAKKSTAPRKGGE